MSGYLLTDMYVVVCGWLKGHHIFHGGELLNPDFIGAYHGTLHTHTHTHTHKIKHLISHSFMSPHLNTLYASQRATYLKF
jgi:hypothetical protein